MTPLYVAVSLKESNMVKALLDHNADPSHEVHPSFKLAQEMSNEEITGILSNVGAKNVSTRNARIDARKTRAMTPTQRNRNRRAGQAGKFARTCGSHKLNRGTDAVDEEPPAQPHTEGMCYICERNKATQKLIPCGHVVSCRGCIKKFIEEHIPCPVCKLSFYATATLQDEIPGNK